MLLKIMKTGIILWVSNFFVFLIDFHIEMVYIDSVFSTNNVNKRNEHGITQFHHFRHWKGDK